MSRKYAHFWVPDLKIKNYRNKFFEKEKVVRR